MELFKNPILFEWDPGNKGKNQDKHNVTNEECEEAFFDPRKRFFKAKDHVSGEERYILIGRTNWQRLLFVVFTMRRNKIRVISARDLNKKERPLYEKRA